MNNVIVTGANGFLGASIVSKLVENKIHVLALINNSSDRLDLIKNDNSYGDYLEIIKCPSDDYDKISTIIEENIYDTIFHFAWEGSAGKERADENIQMCNLKNTLALIRECNVLGIKKIVFASSIMGYESIIAHKSIQSTNINSIYSITKMATDMLARVIADSSNIEYCSAVISNVYGPGEKSPRLINSSIRKLLSHERCSFSSGEQLYDFIYIDDAARAFVKIAEDGINGRNYYIGNKYRRPLKDFLMEMGKALNAEELIGLGDLKDISTVAFDDNLLCTTYLYDDFNFVPEVSFMEGIKRTANWIEQSY